jgi:hypothetical protein
MGSIIDELRENYKSFSDDKLIRIATTDVSGLRPEAIQAMQEEIKRRGLSDGLLAGIEVQTKEISEDELLAYCELLRRQSCPVCNSTSTKLNATMTATVVSYIIMTSSEEQLVIACPDCLDKANKDAMVKTALFGWWGFPSGIYRTIKALLQNKKISNQTRLAEPNEYLKSFVLAQVGTIEANKANSERLKSLVKYLN